MPEAQNRSLRIRERNKKQIMLALTSSKEMLSERKAFKSAHGFDFLDGTDETAKKFPVMESGFSWGRVKTKLVETNSSSGFPQLLRAGVQMVANEAYQNYSTTYADWTTAVQSKKDTELYAPLQGLTFPREIGRQEFYPESSAAGLDLSLKNRKFGTMLPIELELYDDDQTGQFAKQAGLLGEYMALVAEVLVYAKLSGAANCSYGGFNPPASETQPTDESGAWPYVTSAAPFIGGGYNRPTSFGILNQANVQAGYTVLQNQLNLLGLKIAITANRLLIGSADQFSASILMNSAFYPSGAAAAGAVGGSFAINPIKGIADVTMTPFMFKNDGTVTGDSRAWYLTDDTKPAFIVQLREAMMVEQENPTSGKSFEQDIVRFKARSRMNADFIDPRFFWQGNNGSVTS